MHTPHEQQIDALIVHALEQKPAVRLPADFAARVTANLPAAQTRTREPRRKSVARPVAFASMALLTIALFLLAPHVQGNRLSLGFGIEMLLLAQLATVAIGLMRLQNGGL